MFSTTEELVKVLGVSVFLVEAALLFWLVLKGKQLSNPVKWMALIALVIGPILLVFLANFHVFDNSKTVDACANCHVMRPMVNDMEDKESMTLAARHYKNKWINKDQCYGCHKDYGLNGKMKAKMDGYRHLMKYITSTYEEPIRYRGIFKNANCGSCHYEKPNFMAVEMHQPLFAKFKEEEISCTNCHGKAHPSPNQRTPGSEDYERLISQSEYVEEAPALKKFIATLDSDK